MSTTQLVGAPGRAIVEKSGIIPAASFTGSPRSASVAFAANMPTADYVVTLTSESLIAESYLPTLQSGSRAVSGFTVDLNTSTVVGLERVFWHVKLTGE